MQIVRTRSKTPKVSKSGHHPLKAFFDYQNVLYNGVLQERSNCCRLTGKTITEYCQNKMLTVIRAEHPEIEKFNVHPVRSALRRIEPAFQAFWRKCKAKAKKPGFSRLKPLRRMKSIACPRNGFKIRER